MKTLLEWISRTISRFAAWLARVTASPVAPVEEEEQPEQAPRVVAGEVGIFVQCASCGMYHELEAVCHVCGAPLCQDTGNCRLIRTDAVLDQTAVFCALCYASVAVE